MPVQLRYGLLGFVATGVQQLLLKAHMVTASWHPDRVLSKPDHRSWITECEPATAAPGDPASKSGNQLHAVLETYGSRV